MKFLPRIAFMALLAVCLAPVQAQPPASPLNQPDYNKPKLFSDLPERLPVNLTNLEALLHLAVGARISTVIASGLPLTGMVVSASNGIDARIKSIVIKSTNRQGAVLTFTRITAADGTINYIGRMLSKDFGDALQIIKEAGQYIFRKQGLYDMLNE